MSNYQSLDDGDGEQLRTITTAGGAFKGDPDALASMVADRSYDKLEAFGGVAGVAAAVRSDPKIGLTLQERERNFSDRIAKYGRNVLPPAPPKTFLMLVWEALHDKVLILLCIAAIMSIALGLATAEDKSSSWIEGAAILFAVVIVVIVTALNDYQKEKQFRALNAKKDDKQVKAIRAGEHCQVNVHDIQVGDVLIVETGDILSADGLFLNGHNLKMDESSATGETDLLHKTEEKPFMLSGTMCQEGVCQMLVVAVGENSFYGRTMMSLRTEESMTPLEEKLDHLAEYIGKLGLAAAVFTFVVLSIIYCVRLGVNHEKFDMDSVRALLSYITTAIIIVVVAVPEGLPLSVTIALAYSMLKMLKDKNLVRHLNACETMGSATNICSDKTGTLTENKMTVVKGRLCGVNFDSSQWNGSQLSPEEKELIGTGIAVNSTAYEARNDQGIVTFVGNKTETALLTMGTNIGTNYASERERVTTVHAYPFSSKKKRMSTLVAHPSGSGYRLYVKGASEIVLGLCTSVALEGGKTASLDDRTRKDIEQTIHTFASGALRTIALAYVDIPEDRDWTEEPEDGLVCLGVVGIQDPVRREVPAAVRACQDAGIMVRMVTGDNVTTAKNIAKDCGIYQEGFGVVMEGPDFRELSDDEYAEVLPKLQVLARSSPLDKQILVSKLQALGQVVAVTGDGTNDAPALRLADIGFSMGIAGTEVAKEASDVVLMDDNFASIVKAVLWGRNVFDSIRKFLQFQITVNIVAVLLAFIGAVSSAEGESPLRPVQMLWVNLIMDTLAALALATDEPTNDLLEREPNGRDAPLISKEMWKHILGQSAYQLAINLTLLYAGHKIFSVPYRGVEHDTIIFNAFVFQQLMNEFNCRKINGEFNIFGGVTKNKFFLGVMFLTITLQAIMVEFGGEFAGTTHLTAGQWFACLASGVVSLPIGMMLRIIPTHSYRTLRDQRAIDNFHINLIEDDGDAGMGHTLGHNHPSVSHHNEIVLLTPQQRARARMNWHTAVSSIRRQQNVLRVWDMIHRNRRGARKPAEVDPRARFRNTIGKIRAQQRVVSAFKAAARDGAAGRKEGGAAGSGSQRWGRAMHLQQQQQQQQQQGQQSEGQVGNLIDTE